LGAPTLNPVGSRNIDVVHYPTEEPLEGVFMTTLDSE
jgi:hypothetical protein